MEKDINKNIDETRPGESVPADQKKPHSSAFREPKEMEKKSTVNPEEEADMEQERKSATTERD